MLYEYPLLRWDPDQDIFLIDPQSQFCFSLAISSRSIVHLLLPEKILFVCFQPSQFIYFRFYDFKF